MIESVKKCGFVNFSKGTKKPGIERVLVMDKTEREK